ncbi:MAG: hypothetical protein IT320_16505 [Anaerolineae bacterium]|nr:hypothetical protein [Anaerolineae bacterium]
MATQEEQYHELAYYTLAHPDPAFIHQHIVDAHAAQMADADTRPIKLVFALAGLYLAVERGFTGRQVQQAHMQLAKQGKSWPTMPLPEARGTITVAEVLSATPGEARDAMIHAWCADVWAAYTDVQPQVRDLVKRLIDV